MEQATLFPITTDVVVRKNGSATRFNAGDVIAALVAATQACGLLIPPDWKGRMGRDAKHLLEAGYDPPTVCDACFQALRASRPHMVQQFANEIYQARRGEVWSWIEYKNYLLREARMSESGVDALQVALEGCF